jgi:hypothetical protein
MSRPLAVLIVMALLVSSSAATEAIIATPERCAALIALFDEIIVNRFDYRILKLQDYDLAEARRWREQAEVECGQGQYWFGVRAIEDALERIGVAPPQPPGRSED